MGRKFKRSKGKDYDVINANCLDVLPTIPDGYFTHALTSPPYNRLRNDKYKHFKDINLDWYSMNVEVITQLLRVTTGFVFYNIQTNYYNREDVYKLIGHFSDKIVDIHIWVKSNPMPASGFNVTNSVEYFLVLGSESLKANYTYTKNSILTSVNSNMPKGHKAVMKPEVCEHFVSNYMQEDDTVIDPFGGSGTTGLVCKDYSLYCLMIEISKDYYKDILDTMSI